MKVNEVIIRLSELCDKNVRDITLMNGYVRYEGDIFATRSFTFTCKEVLRKLSTFDQNAEVVDEYGDSITDYEMINLRIYPIINEKANA